MAWLFKRKGSAYWHIGFKKATGKPAESLRLRHDDPAQTREARDRLREANEDEKFVKGDEQRFVKWMPEFLRLRYGSHPGNLKAFTNRWRALEPFLSSRKILFPKDLTGQAAWDYVVWRTGPKPREGGVRRAKKNTALHELKLLRMMMRHAIAMGWASRSPVEGVRIPWDDPKEKPEIEPEHLPVIMKALKERRPEFMTVMFKIAYFTGCRLNDTYLLLRHVDLDRKLIHFPEPKGKKPFTRPCPPELIPLFTELKRDTTRQRAFEPDGPMRNMSARWLWLFRSIGLAQYSFHCTRVSYISRCIRAKLPETVTLRLVNHCSVLVNRLYQRFRGEDLREAADSIVFPSLDASENPGLPAATPEPRQDQGNAPNVVSPSPPSRPEGRAG